MAFSNASSTCFELRPWWLCLLSSVLVITLLASFWGLFYTGTPSGDTCWAIRSWEFGAFREDQKTWYEGLPGTDTRLAWEDDADFSLLYLLHVAAITASAVGLLWSTGRLQTQAWQSGALRSYTVSLVLYFFVNFVVNSVVQISFVRNRCNDHNILRFLPDQDIPRTTLYLPHEGWSDASTSMARFSKALYLSMLFAGSFLTNTILQRTLLKKVSLMGGSQRCERSLIFAVVSNLILLVISGLAVPVSLGMFVLLMEDGVAAVGGTDTGETLTLLFNLIAGVFVLLHVLISIVLMVAFRDIAIEHDEHWAGTVKLLTCAGLLIGSTFLCYGNMALMLTNAYMLLPLDSVINDICIILLSLSDTTEYFKMLLSSGLEERKKPVQFDPSASVDPKSSMPSVASKIGSTIQFTMHSTLGPLVERDNHSPREYAQFGEDSVTLGTMGPVVEREDYAQIKEREEDLMLVAMRSQSSAQPLPNYPQPSIRSMCSDPTIKTICSDPQRNVSLYLPTSFGVWGKDSNQEDDLPSVPNQELIVL